MENVLSWKQALDQGYSPKNYDYTKCPIGVFEAALDFKIWANKTDAVTCYFTSEGGVAFQISVFKRQADEQYKIKDCDIDFTTCPIDCIYQLTIERNTKGKPFIKNCSFLKEAA